MNKIRIFINAAFIGVLLGEAYSGKPNIDAIIGWCFAFILQIERYNKGRIL